MLGTMHAVEARRRGWDVVHLDIDPEPQAASARNSGMVWIGPRAPGTELELALQARTLWLAVASRAPGIGFRADGSLIVATDEAHLAVFDQVLERDDAERRGLRYLAPTAVEHMNPVVRGPNLGALHCSLDAVIEPRLALPALRDQLLAGAGYAFHGGRQVWEVDSGRVVDTAGHVHSGDLVVLCLGARSTVLTNLLTARAPLHRVRVQMMQTAPFQPRLPTMVAAGDSVRFWAGFDVPARTHLPAADPVVDEFELQVLCSQRSSGSLTIGETHLYEEPFGFDLSERPYDHMAAALGELLGCPLPAVVRRWDGMYLKCSDDRIWYRENIDEGVLVVTGAGGRGMTLAPAIAEDTFSWLDDGIESGGSLPGALRPPI
jgi:FAD dependent oxidoreductase TIGR03364